MMDERNIEERRKRLVPLWEGNTVYAESIFVLENFLGEIRPFRLAYPIEKIISVTSADFSVRYEEGKDFCVNEYGELEIIRGAIPYLQWKDYRLPAFDPENWENMASADGLGAYKTGDLFSDREGMRAWQLAVSYTHAESALYDVTAGKRGKFARFLEKLEKERCARVASYGDSITYGWAASGMQDIRKPPYCEKYADMIVGALEEKFGAKIEHVNFSVSGKCADWAAEEENVKPVADFKPDLVILAFGMNDAGGFRPRTFAENIRKIIAAIRAEQPQAEFLLVSPIVPNPTVAFTAGSSIERYHGEYPRAFEEIERAERGVGYANVTAVHRILLERKSLQDTLSNNVNHPNDFMHGIYAQVALKTLLDE